MRSASAFFEVTSSTSQDGRTSHASRSAGASVCCRACVDHALGAEALERADGSPVVAVLGVVVVLDHDGAAALGPGEESGAAVGGEHAPGGELVRRCHHDGVGIGRLEFADDEAALVDGHGHDVETGAPDDRPLIDVARILHRQPPHPLSVQGAADEAQPLGEAGADQHPLRLGQRPADAAEVGGESAP